MSTLKTRAVESPASPRPLRLGFLGLGWIGQHRCERLLQEAPVEMVAFCDQEPKAAEVAARLAAGAVAADDVHALLALDLDGVVIATPSALHAEQSMAALAAGCAVFCQKPLGRSAAETAQVVQAARRADRLLHCDFCYRHVRGVEEMRRRLMAGAIGEVYAVQLTFHNAYGPDKPWYYQRGLAGGGCLMDLGIHLLDLLQWMMPQAAPVAVTSRLFRNGRPWRDAEDGVEDFATALIQLEGGACASLECSWRLPLGCDVAISASFYGAEGGLRLENVNDSFYDFRVLHFRGTQRELIADPPDAWGGRAAVAWAQRLAENHAYDPVAQEYVRVADALDWLYAAAHDDAASGTPDERRAAADARRTP